MKHITNASYFQTINELNPTMNIMRFILLSALLFTSVFIEAQDSIPLQKPTLSLSGYADVFYVYDFNEPTTDYRQPFLYNHNRHNEFNLNLGFVKFNVEHHNYRANLSLNTGTYVNDNYAAEPNSLKNIAEANIGISLNKTNNLWLDAGIFASHIGFESAVSSDNWNLTRSLLAENSPYFLSGAKLTYKTNNNLELAALICNGWQRIQRIQGNSLPSFGTQLKYTTTDLFTLNWSTFIGTDDPDSTRRIRYFNNFYGQFQVTEKFGIIAGFDIGTQQHSKNNSTYDTWFSPVIIGQFAINKNWKTAIRAEYYQDQTGIIIPTGTPNGFRTLGFSFNVDYTRTENMLIRLEARWLNSEDNIFNKNSSMTNNNYFVGTSIALKFNEILAKK